MTAGFTFFLSSNSTSSIDSTSLLSSDHNQGVTDSYESILTFDNAQNASGVDAFGGKDFFGTPDFSNVTPDMVANASNAETVGSVAYNSAETVGSVACADFGGASVSVGGGFSGGDCGGSSGGGFVC